MNRLDRIFSVPSHKVLVAYLCAGDPDAEETCRLARACVRRGADVIELGVPFSDPTADGPAIQRASYRAIAAGGGFDASLRTARALRDAEPDVGIVLFGYYNPIVVRGENRAAREASDAGVDAFLVVDLPIEECEALGSAADQRNLGLIPVLAPTSRAERIAAVREARGRWPMPFLYYVSVTGVTGAGTIDAADAGERAGVLGRELSIPTVVGFGIDSREKARLAARDAAGVVVGTAIVRAIESGHDSAARCGNVERLVGELRAGIDQASARG
ncbi:MAG: tryptophan synthase subunit alpha [Polyangiaceae bacterium]